MKKIFIFIVLLNISNFTFGQKFPFVIKPSYTVTLETTKGTQFEFPHDTLWVLRHSQYKVAIEKAKKLELTELQIIEYKKIVFDLTEQGAEKDSLVTILKADRDFYQKNWNTCKTDVLKINKKGKRQRLYTKIAIICIPIAAALGFGSAVYLRI